jgi:diaminopimelate decarboxylase
MDAGMTLFDDVAGECATEGTPRRIFHPRVARERIERVARLCEDLGRSSVRVVPGYSVKTNPRAELVQAAREHGFHAETISSDERRWAARNGFGPERTIANGPEPIRAGSAPLAFAFADGVEAFARNVRDRVATVQGIRLRPSMIRSRFGVPVDDERMLRAAVASSPSDVMLGIGFHVRREDYDGASWRDVAADVLDRANALAEQTQRTVLAFDIGGGWTPEEFDRDFAADVRWLVERLAAALSACRTLIAEPGQAICTPAEALLTEVLEVRERAGRREAIVDAAYSDWPQMHAYPHRVYGVRGERLERLKRGPDRIGGRTCLEYDAVDGLLLPAGLQAGDRLLIADVGSYDHSMAFDFARGGDARTVHSD